MDRGFGDNVGVQTVAEVNRVDVVTTVPHESASMSFPSLMCFPTESFHSARFGRDPFFSPDFSPPHTTQRRPTHHSKSLYIIVKNTWRNKLTALINTDNR